jgi:two-component system, NtrC family, sensor kinase
MVIEVPDAVRQLVDGMVDAAVVLDGDRQVLHCNRGYEALCPVQGAELARRIEGGVGCDELFVPAGDRSHVVSAVPIAIEGHAIVVESYRDVTAQRRLAVAVARERRAKTDLEDKVRDRSRLLEVAQSQLVHVDKMSSLGRLVAGIAHELNNPINFIYGNVDFLGQYLGDLIRLVDAIDAEPLPAEVRARFDRAKADAEYDHVRADWQKLVRSIRAGAERTAGIVRDLRTYSRASGAELREVDLVGQLDITLTLITPLVRNRIQIRRSVSPEVPTVIGNPGHIGQIFMNLLSNAAQAIAGEGWIELDVTPVVGRSAVRVSVADSGPGIDPAVMERVADPFFTTKEVGEGTGLGLWITDSIVRAHGGTLAWSNRPGAGAEFVVTLPVRPAAAVPSDHSGEWRGG